MNIEQIKQLDVGIKGLRCSGKVTWAGESKNIVGTNEQTGNDYDFWSQFIVVKDMTDKIGVSIIIDEDQRSLKKGDMVTIENAELKEYYKDDKPVLKLQGKLSTNAPQDSPQGSQQPHRTTKAPQSDPETEGKVRHGLVCACIQGGMKLSIKELEGWKKYIMTGQPPDSYEGVDPAYEEARASAQSQVDDDIPF